MASALWCDDTAVAAWSCMSTRATWCGGRGVCGCGAGVCGWMNVCGHVWCVGGCGWVFLGYGVFGVCGVCGECVCT